MICNYVVPIHHQKLIAPLDVKVKARQKHLQSDSIFTPVIWRTEARLRILLAVIFGPLSDRIAYAHG
jgi:hypothetical protein